MLVVVWREAVEAVRCPARAPPCGRVDQVVPSQAQPWLAASGTLLATAEAVPCALEGRPLPRNEEGQAVAASCMVEGLWLVAWVAAPVVVREL